MKAGRVIARTIFATLPFYTTVGHLPALFESPAMARFLLAGIQFILGDLDTDTTPGTK
jgi:hypothetical protein